VPYQLTQQKVEVRATPTTVEIFHHGTRVASHARAHKPYTPVTNSEHPEHPVPRILPSPRLPAFTISGFMAHSRFLRAHCYAVPPCTGDTAKATILGVSTGRALADRLAANESRCVTSGAAAICVRYTGTSG
jgi:hypothetical protein